MLARKLREITSAKKSDAKPTRIILNRLLDMAQRPVSPRVEPRPASTPQRHRQLFLQLADNRALRRVLCR